MICTAPVTQAALSALQDPLKTDRRPQRSLIPHSFFSSFFSAKHINVRVYSEEHTSIRYDIYFHTHSLFCLPHSNDSFIIRDKTHRQQIKHTNTRTYTHTYRERERTWMHSLLFEQSTISKTHADVHKTCLA